MLLRKQHILFCLLILFLSTVVNGPEVKTADICIYGGTLAGVVAANVVLFVPKDDYY